MIIPVGVYTEAIDGSLWWAYNTDTDCIINELGAYQTPLECDNVIRIYLNAED